MSEKHIEYMKSMCSGIVLDGATPFVSHPPSSLAQSHFLEVRPPLDTFQELVPFVLCKHYPMQPGRDGRRYERLARTGSALRFLRREYKREYRYRLDFWMHDPAQEILSNASEPGITEQIQLYLVSHERYLDGNKTVHVRLGPSGFVEDPDGSSGLFYIYQEILFRDDLCVEEAAPSLSGANIRIRWAIA
jgi:hypothetical protein